MLFKAKKILIVDDEPLSRQKIRRLIEEREEEFAIAEAENGLRALEMMHSFKPDIVFLDIEMPGLSGFEVLWQIEERTAKIVFQTAYDEFALKAFEENACDYVLKPFTRERFYNAFDRALNAIEVDLKLKGLENTLLKHNNYLKKIVVKQGNQLIPLIDDDILCFISKDHYTFIYTKTSEYICELSLDHLSERLNPATFIRLHRNNIARLDAIISVSANNQMTIKLSNGFELPVSRSKRSALRELLSNSKMPQT